MVEKRCEMCVFVKYNNEHTPFPAELECHRYPPNIRTTTLRFIFPVVDSNSWCGEFKENT